jgi:hypothetical protein
VEYESEYRRQYCRDRIARISDEYRRAQAPARIASERRERIVDTQIRSIWNRVRRRAAQRAPAYRS